MARYTSLGESRRDLLASAALDERHQIKYNASNNTTNLNVNQSACDSNEMELNLYEPSGINVFKNENQDQTKLKFIRNRKYMILCCIFFFVFGGCATYTALSLTNRLQDKSSALNAENSKCEKPDCENKTTVVETVVFKCEKFHDNDTIIVNESTTVVPMCDGPKSQADCPAGFALYKPSDKCYKLIQFRANQSQQMTNCARLAPGAHLAAPLNADENNFIDSLILNSTGGSGQTHCRYKSSEGKDHNDYYLAGRNIDKNGCSEFVWEISDDMMLKMKYRNFDDGEPNCVNGKENCIHMSKNLKWNDNACDFTACAICELSLK